MIKKFYFFAILFLFLASPVLSWGVSPSYSENNPLLFNEGDNEKLAKLIVSNSRGTEELTVMISFSEDSKKFVNLISEDQISIAAGERGEFKFNVKNPEESAIISYVVKQSPGSPQDNEMIQLAPGYSLSFSADVVGEQEEEIVEEEKESSGKGIFAFFISVIIFAILAITFVIYFVSKKKRENQFVQGFFI